VTKMQNKILNKMICIVIILLFFISTKAFATKVDGYDSLLKLLPGAELKMEYNLGLIKASQKFIIDKQLKKKSRELKFLDPIDIFKLNAKYTALSFDIIIKTGTRKEVIEKTGIFTLLFKYKDPNSLEPTKIFLGWLNDKDLKLYNNININSLCSVFRDIGVQDCFPKLHRISPDIKKVIHNSRDKNYVGKADIIHTHSFSDITSGIVKETFIDDKITRNTELNNALSKKANIAHTHNDIIKILSDKAKTNHNHDEIYSTKKYINSLENQIIELNKKIEEMSNLLQSMSKIFNGVHRKGNNIVFNNLNIQIVNGTGSTKKINGHGNLIIGYNESRNNNSRKGSHNIIVGDKHNYASYGGIVTGYNNTISGSYSCVNGGSGNTAANNYSTIIGGKDNSASGEYSIVTGGKSNIGSGKFSNVTGGKNNKSSGEFSNISGGLNRSVSGTNPHFSK
jgi:hypothetical protein